MRLAEILGYQLDMTRCAALRCLHRRLADSPLKPADTAALLLVRDAPGCDQTMLGRALAGNRSVGMKVASRLEARGLLTRGEGRNRRSKGLYLTGEGEMALAGLLRRHESAEAAIAARLSPAERSQLLALLAKVQQGLRDEEEEGLSCASTANFDAAPSHMVS
jgi:DNA-binding MarR family transcriptional regulator